MASISPGIENYLDKIHCLIACLNNEDWILNASRQSIETIFDSATEIENCLSQSEARKLKESLTIVYPDYDFTRCGDLVLKAILLHPQSDENAIMYALNKYIDIYSKNDLCNLLFNLLQTKKLKEQAVSLINNYKDQGIVRMLEAKSCLYLWEQMILEKNENLENYLRHTFEEDTPLFIDCLTMSSKRIGSLILDVIVRYLNNQSDLKMWFTLLNYRNIKITSVLCSEYPELMEALLKFLIHYASEAECHEGKSFSWNHSIYPLHEFVDILHFLLTNDGLVGVTVNEFINRQINGFNDNFSFWLDIKTLL